MSKITKIEYKKDRQRYWIFVDQNYCCSIRERTFQGMDLFIGQEISCEKIKEMESFYWKEKYGKKAWEKEKIRLNKVKNFIELIDSRILAKITGFGADTTNYIRSHPKETGRPDIEIVLKDDQSVILLFVEVSGTEKKRGNDYWIRPDKLQYCQNHPDKDVWILLHYALPEEKIVFIQPNLTKKYHYIEIDIRNSKEYYVIFDDFSPETKSEEEFKSYLQKIINQHCSSSFY